jgi:hypothetical protein
MQSLLDLLRGSLDPHTLDEAEFGNLLHVAREENLLPYVAERLRNMDAQLSLSLRQQLEEIHRKAQFSSFAWTETLKNTLAAFHGAAIPVITLKGPCLAERIYGNTSLRTCYDLDLLVRRSDRARAEQLLTDIGFSPNGHADDYHRPWSRQGINLELHHNVENPHAFDFDVNAAWARAVPAEFHGAPLWLMAPADELLYLCLHAVRHRFERLCLIVDLQLAFRHLSLAVGDSHASGNSVFENIFALGWMMAARFDQELPPPPTMQLTRRNQARLEQIAGSLWQELMLAPPPTLDWIAQHRFYLELEDPGWNRLRRRMRHQQILATRLIDDDFNFAGRFHLHRNWQVRILRPLRLLIKTMRPSPKML